MSDDIKSPNPIDQLLAGFIQLIPDAPADISEQPAPPASDGFSPEKENSKSDEQVRECENSEVAFDPSFSYEGYQVVRGEYFAHINEPSITFNDYTISVNTACIRKAPHVEYVQLLIHPEQRKLVIRPCVEDEKDSFLWCNVNRKPKQITCRTFFAKVVRFMEWNPNYRYKLIGKMIRSQDEYLFAFDMKATEIFQRLIRNDENGKEVRTTIRRPVYPDEWKDQFGMAVDEHRKSLQVNIFNGYAVFGIKESKKSADNEENYIKEGGDKE